MKKIFTLAAAVLASVSMWAAYAPTADEVIILQDVYDASATEAGFSKHAAIAWGGTASTNSKKAGDPYNNGEATSSNVNGYPVKGNGKGKNITVSFEGCSQIIVYHEKHASRYVELRADSKTGDLIGKGEANTYFTTVDLDANTAYSIFLHGTTTGSDDQDFVVYAVKLIKGETCNDPEAVLTLSKTAMFVNEQAHLDFTTNGTSDDWGIVVKKDGATATYGVDYSLSAYPATYPVSIDVTPLTAGTFELTAYQESDGTYCAFEKSVTATVSEANPVTAVTIDGPTAGVIGQELTYTATAEGATAYQWLVDDIDANTNAATFKYTAAKGNHSIVCKARNQFNKDGETDTWIKSNEINLTVTKVCGMLIKATHTAAKTADIDPTSVVGGTVDKNTQDGGKLGSNGHYFGVKLAAGTFMAGDVVTCEASTLNGGNTATLFSDKGTTSLGSAEFDAESKIATITLTESAEWIYLYRKESNCNATMGSISVTRSCEASNDATIASLTINGEKVEENDGVFAYTVSAKENLAQVAVVYAIHPMATATPASGFNVDVPAAGDPANTQVITVTAEDGTTQKAYTVSVTKSASLSNDATLKALSVEGFELTPAFDPAVTAYTITKAYSAELPAVGLVTATTNDANATANVAYNELVVNEILVQVLAEDEETANTYSITVLSAAAKKDLLEASFSNGANGYILGGNIRVPYLYGTAEPVFVAAKFWKADGEPSAAVVDGQLVVTGADESVEKYTIEYVAVTPMEASYDLITFTEVPSYIFSVYGWADDKGVKISKDVEEAAQKRISEGRDRIYIALPAAESVILTGGSAGARPIKVTVNGAVYDKVTSTPKSGETVTIELSQSSANFVGIESNGNNGDAGFTEMQLVKGTATALGNTEAEVKAVKVVRDGQLLIMKNGVLYNAQGAIVK